ncbi:glycerol-3-phosphate 1-O-acyltransferase [bacterium]|nr:MAG: glycerol-3-phosphate 1-O-acyltransferase [bacterium]
MRVEDRIDPVIAFGIALFAFLIGSIPFGVIVARRQGVDLTTVGSGNIGATNAMRVLGTKWGLIVFALDVLKGVIPSVLASVVFVQGLGPLDRQPTAMILGAFAILGHMFSPWIGFKGGKGISTILGVALGAIPLCGLLAFGTMLVVLAITRYVSLASLVGVASGLIWNLVLGDSRQMLPVLLVLFLFITWKHRANIRRLLGGTESKFSFRRK